MHTEDRERQRDRAKDWPRDQETDTEGRSCHNRQETEEGFRSCQMGKAEKIT